MASATLSRAGRAAAPVEDFATLLDATLGENAGFAGSVISGKVVKVDDGYVTVDVGLKSEGRIPLAEFAPAEGQKPEVKAGDTVDVYVVRYEDRDGSILLSRERARRDEAWTVLEKSFEANERVQGVIFGRVKGGFTVDLSGATAFLPGSQVDIRPMRDIGPLMGSPQPFQILKMDRARGNIVVSRRAVLEEARAEQRGEVIKTLKEGTVLDGVVKNLTDYGAFVDLGGVDGLLHVTDIAWRRVNHPSEVLTVGQPVKVQVIRFNPETQRISLGMKQLQADPWDGAGLKYPVGARFSGRVTNITDYGAFVELEPGIEGLVHVSEMSWTKTNVHPGKIVSSSQQVDVMVLDVDEGKRRISLGIKQAVGNPYELFLEAHPPGSVIEGEIRNITGVRPLHRAAERHRRPRARLRPLLGGGGRARDDALREGPDRAGQGAGRGRREAARLARHQADAGRPRLRGHGARPQGRHRHLHGDEGRGERHRGPGGRGPDRLHPPRRAGP
jgi:small subunit ribosomal protein S1